MRGSLQEQLLNSGLVNKEQLEKATQQKKAKNKSSPANKKTRNKNAKSKQITAKEPVKHQAPQPEVVLDKAIRVEIKKLLRANKLNDKNGEIPYNYVINKQVKRFFVNAEQLTRVKNGELVITNWNDRTYLIPASVVEDLHKLHPTLPIASAKDQTNSENSEKIDDEYADYVIPDDLTW